MHKDDMGRLGIADGEIVTATAEFGDQTERNVDGLRATAYDVPKGCCAGYYPECNPLIPWRHHAEGSKTPAASQFHTSQTV